MTEKENKFLKNYKHPNNPNLTVDAIVEYSHNNKEGIILIDRKYSPQGLALPGGFVEEGLTVEENAKKEVKEETGLEYLIYDPEKPFCVKSKPDRDPRGYMVTMLYIGQGVGICKPQEDEDAKEAYHLSFDEVYNLAKEEKNKEKFAFPDHFDMIVEYIQTKGYIL